MDIIDLEIKNLQQVLASCDGMALYLRFMTIGKEQCAAQLGLNGPKRIVMLSKFGAENMKIDLESGRRAKNVLLEERMN